MFRTLRLCCIVALTALGAIACQAGASPDDSPLAVTAGPEAPIDVVAGGQAVVTLESVTAGELADVLQSDGLVPLDDGPVLLSAFIALEGDGQAVVEIGPRGGPWESIATSRPPIIPGIVLEPRAGAFARVSIASIDGARIVGGVGPLSSWVSAARVGPNREARARPIGG